MWAVVLIATTALIIVIDAFSWSTWTAFATFMVAGAAILYFAIYNKRTVPAGIHDAVEFFETGGLGCVCGLCLVFALLNLGKIFTTETVLGEATTYNLEQIGAIDKKALVYEDDRDVVVFYYRDGAEIKVGEPEYKNRFEIHIVTDEKEAGKVEIIDAAEQWINPLTGETMTNVAYEKYLLYVTAEQIYEVDGSLEDYTELHLGHVPE